eukprot:2093617-Prymnesium_polylepis.1
MDLARGVSFSIGSERTEYGERTEYDKGFYITALQFQQNNRLANGCTADEFQKRAFAFVQYIMPNVAQKPTRQVRRSYGWPFHRPKIPHQANEVFQKQKGTVPTPTFIGAPALGGHNLELFATCCGVDTLQLRGRDDRDDPSGGAMFVGNDKKWCDGCPHKRGSCTWDPDNTKPPPPSVYLDTNRWRTKGQVGC